MRSPYFFATPVLYEGLCLEPAHDVFHWSVLSSPVTQPIGCP